MVVSTWQFPINNTVVQLLICQIETFITVVSESVCVHSNINTAHDGFLLKLEFIRKKSPNNFVTVEI